LQRIFNFEHKNNAHQCLRRLVSWEISNKMRNKFKYLIDFIDLKQVFLLYAPPFSGWRET